MRFCARLFGGTQKGHISNRTPSLILVFPIVRFYVREKIDGVLASFAHFDLDSNDLNFKKIVVFTSDQTQVS